VITKELAIMSLRPNVEWTMNGDDVENIIWHSPDVLPLTELEVKTEISRLSKLEKSEVKAKQDARESAITKLAEIAGLTKEELDAIL
jgi:hypothetical protein